MKKLLLIILISGVFNAVFPQEEIKTDENVVIVKPEERNFSKPVNTICPVEGKKVSDKIPYLIYENEIIGFCCKGCDDEFINNSSYYLKKIERRKK